MAGPKSSVRWPVEHYDLAVSFDLDGHSIEGVSRMTLPRKGAKVAGFLLNKDFIVQRASLGDIPVNPHRREGFDPNETSPIYGTYDKWDASKAALWTIEIPKQARKKRPLIFEVEFSGSLYVPPDERRFSREKIAFEVEGTIGPEGIYLSPEAFWYPGLPDGLATYKVTARLPAGWNCVTDGVAEEATRGDGWVEIAHTLQNVSNGISFSAGQYMVRTVENKGITVSTYFFPPQANLAEGYIEACRRYIDMYSELIAPYPFPKFAVVDNFLPTGYGMPGWTLLGSEVLRLPHIKNISLGHEVLHNWFGNSLLVDYRTGNWCEGLTVYLADYKYREDADSAAAVEYRMNVLRDYAAYVTPENDYPLTKFAERRGPFDRAIGYGKAMMAFHMLRQILDQQNPDIFLQVLRETYEQYQWQPIGWNTWQKEFERRLGQRLDWFFEQWLRYPGAPRISLENVNPEITRYGWEVQFEVATEPGKGGLYSYLLSIRALSDVGLVDIQTFISSGRQAVEMSGAGELRAIMLDPGFDLFRVIYPGEVPVTMAAFFGDKDGVLVVPASGARAVEYREIARGLVSEGQRVVADTEVTPETLKRSLWLFGGPDENSLWSRFPPDPTRLNYLPEIKPRWKEEKLVPEGLVFRRQELRGEPLIATIISPHPSAEGKTIVHTIAGPGADSIKGTRKLTHYGKYSYLLFRGDQNIQKGVWAVSGESPMTWRGKVKSKKANVKK